MIQLIRKVTTKMELDVFNQIVEKVWLEKGYTVEHATLESNCYILYNQHEVPVGTAEFRAVTPESEVLKYYPPFNVDHTVEVDKIAIMKEHRGPEHFARLLGLILDYCKENHIDNYISLLEPSLFNLLKNEMKLPIDVAYERSTSR
ncbi:hypothetical protein PMJ10TS2_05540 [Paenibacillus melissococcoides]